MLRLLLFGALLCSLAPLQGQNLFRSAPPATEEALKKRIDEYYALMKEGRFRQSDAYIAEDSKDAYYEQEKKRIRGHEIIRLNWEKDFQKAVAVVVIQTELVMRGQKVEVGAPFSSRWKLENGDWYLHIDNAGKESPFGKLKAGPESENKVDPEALIKNPELVFNLIKVEKELVELKSYEKSTDSIRILNGMPGSISLSFQLEQAIPGFTFEIEKPDLNAQEETRVVFHYDPGTNKAAKPTLTGRLQIDPFGKVYEIRVQFGVPPEVMKQLPGAK